LKNDITK